MVIFFQFSSLEKSTRGDFGGDDVNNFNPLLNQLFKGLPHLEKFTINTG